MTRCNLLLVVGVLCVALTPTMARESRQDSDLERSVLREALDQAERGNFEAAALRTRQGLQAMPSSVLLHNMAGAILMLTGDRSGSEKAFQAVHNLVPDNAIASYGIGLLRLAAGDLAQADLALEAATKHGDAGICLLARQYVAFLRGSRGAASVALPMELDTARRAIALAVAHAEGNGQRVLEDAPVVLNDPTVARYEDYRAALMTFDPAHPIRWGLRPLPRNLLAVQAKAKGIAVSGTVQLRAGDNDASYVAFRMDGKFLAVVNSRPFVLAWDSATVPNGVHIVETVAYDGTGQDIRTTRQEIVTQNASAPAHRDDRLTEARLWRLLALRPSRASVAALAAQAAHKLGDESAARRWSSLALAVDPSVWPDLEHIVRPRPVLEPAFWRAAPQQKLVALTFDDGPRPGITEQILDILTREQVPATFFVIGRHAAASPDLVMRLAQAGMEIGNHSFSHPNLARASDATIRHELVRTNACVEHVTGIAPQWFRPPGGNLSERVSRIAASLGLQACMWTVNGEQKELEGSAPLAAHILAGVRPGAIVLLHNGRQPTVTALPKIIGELRRRGYTFVTISELHARSRDLHLVPVLQ